MTTARILWNVNAVGRQKTVRQQIITVIYGVIYFLKPLENNTVVWQVRILHSRRQSQMPHTKLGVKEIKKIDKFKTLKN